MKITIVTPSFNQGRFIAETIRSIWSQEGDFSIEHIVMDGGSTDETVTILRQFERALKAGEWPLKCQGITFSWVSEKDKGQSHAINKGFRQATGDYIAWLNSDDTYEPGTIQKALSYLEAHPDEIMAYGEGYYLDETDICLYDEGYYLREPKKRFSVEHPFNINSFAESCYITQPSVFLRHEVLERVGYVDESLHYCMDYDWWIRIGKTCKIGYIPEYLANTRVYPETKTSSGADKAIREIIKTVTKHYGKIPGPWIYHLAGHKVNAIITPNTKIKRYIHLGLAESYLLYLKARINKELPIRDIKRILSKKGWQPENRC